MANGDYVGGEKAHMDYLFAWLQLVSTAAPTLTDFTAKLNQYGGNYGTWVTLEDLSDGPYMLLIVRNDPDYSSGSIKFRLTVDGTLLHTNAAWKATTGTNHFIGLPFGANSSENFGPVFVRESFKLEAYNATSGSRSQYAYCQYTLE